MSQQYNTTTGNNFQHELLEVCTSNASSCQLYCQPRVDCTPLCTTFILISRHFKLVFGEPYYSTGTSSDVSWHHTPRITRLHILKFPLITATLFTLNWDKSYKCTCNEIKPLSNSPPPCCSPYHYTTLLLPWSTSCTLQCLSEYLQANRDIQDKVQLLLHCCFQNRNNGKVLLYLESLLVSLQFPRQFS